MCGIFGTINKSLEEDTLNTIKHRGPDAYGIKTFQFASNLVSLGHRRLSIVDLTEAGNQPMVSNCGQFALIYNGEVYNHHELRKKLLNTSFKGHSDTETLLYYLIEFGIESVCDFNGIFAFAFLDLNKGKLHLARDPFGVKPLYYSFSGSNLIFSSEIRPIKSLLPEIKLNKQALSELLKFRYNPAPDTLIDSVCKLKPGHFISISLGNQLKYEETFFVKPVKQINIDFTEALDEYGRIFELAVKRQLMSDVELGILLSGGVDSALVGYFAQKHSTSQLKTFTVGFDENDDSNELFDAQQSAKFLGTNHHEIIVTSQDFIQTFNNACEITEEPLGTTSIIPMFFLNKEVSKHLKVVLTGQGADEPLGGYTRYQGEWLANKLPHNLFKVLKPISRYIKNENLYRAINSLGERNILDRFVNIYSLFSEKEIYDLTGMPKPDYTLKLKYFYENLLLKNRNSLDAMFQLDAKMNLADDLLNYTDKISMNFSLETRVPILDTELVRYIDSLPYNYKIKYKKGKLIHKRFAEQVLPKEIINRPKKGFKSPTNKWFKGEMGNYFLENLTSQESKLLAYFNKKAIEQIFNIHLSGKMNKEKQLFSLVSIYYWFQSNF